MAIKLPDDFREFLRLLDANGVEYLLVGGYAVAHHGYPRATADMDIWVNATPENAERVAAALRAFSFETPDLKPDLFVDPESIVRMGVPPLRIEILTTLSGVSFDDCYASRERIDMDGVPVSVIDLKHLKANKRAAGRHRDHDDLERLP